MATAGGWRAASSGAVLHRGAVVAAGPRGASVPGRRQNAAALPPGGLRFPRRPLRAGAGLPRPRVPRHGHFRKDNTSNYPLRFVIHIVSSHCDCSLLNTN